MPVVTTRVLIEKFSGLQVYVPPNEHAVLSGCIESTFKNEIAAAEFRIPAADGVGDVVFYNREMLARFASIHVETQNLLLKCIRNAMHYAQVTEIHLEIARPCFAKRFVKISALQSGPNPKIFGQGDLSFIM